MATEWNLSRDGETYGPYTSEELREMAVDGNIVPTDLVWKEGLDDWVEARKLKALWEGVAVSAPPSAVMTDVQEESTTAFKQDANTSMRSQDSKQLSGSDRTSRMREKHRTKQAWQSAFYIMLGVCMAIGIGLGHVVYVVLANRDIEAYKAAHPGSYVRMKINYFNVAHWESIVYGLVAGALLALIVGLIMWLLQPKAAKISN